MILVISSGRLCAEIVTKNIVHVKYINKMKVNYLSLSLTCVMKFIFQFH